MKGVNESLRLFFKNFCEENGIIHWKIDVFYCTFVQKFKTMNIPYTITHLIDIEEDPVPFYTEKPLRMSAFSTPFQTAFPHFIMCQFL